MSRVKKRNNQTANQSSGNGSAKSPARRRNRSRGKSASGGVKVADARFKIIAKSRSKIVDARDKLASLAKTTDARQKLKKIRDRKHGKLNVKTTPSGGITITTKTDGKLVLTTAKKAGGGQTNQGVKKARPAIKKKIQPQGRQNVNRNAGANRMASALGIRDGGVAKRRNRPSRGEGAAPSELLLARPYFRIRTEPDELPYHNRQAQRSPERARYNEHDDRRQPRNDTYAVAGIYGRHVTDLDAYPRARPSASVSQASYSAAETYVSPLQGTKVIVSNLHDSVSRSDMVELFGDIGPLKRAKMIEEGIAEIVFVEKAHALKAIEIYHNRQLDGRPMKVKIVNDFGSESLHYSNFAVRESRPPPVVHRALFSEKPKPSLGMAATRPSYFSVTVDNRKIGGRPGYRH